MINLPIDAQITFLYTRDLARSAAFYENAPRDGFELAVDQGSCRVYRVAGRQAYLGICQSDDTPEDASGLIFTLVTGDVDAWYERVVARGWDCEHAPRHNAKYGIYHFFLRDPSGYRIEIQRFADEHWDGV